MTHTLVVTRWSMAGVFQHAAVSKTNGAWRGGGQGATDIFVMRQDGTDVRRLTDDATEEGTTAFAWQAGRPVACNPLATGEDHVAVEFARQPRSRRLPTAQAASS
jgi:hypothetical protein